MTSKTISGLLITFSLVYFGWLAQRAHADLTESHRVEGLRRVYLPPYKTGELEVFDPRPGPLGPELLRRFGHGTQRPDRRPDRRPDQRPNPLPDDPLELARSLKLRPTPATGPGDGRRPRLIQLDDRMVLVLRAFNGRLVIFDPERGVILSGTMIPAGAPAFVLNDAIERPW